MRDVAHIMMVTQSFEIMTPFKNIDDKKLKVVKSSSLMRWKLDMTERFGHQRRKLLPDYEFYGLYNVDETVDQDKDDSKRSSDSAKSEISIGSEQHAKPASLYVHPESVVLTDDLVKKM